MFQGAPYQNKSEKEYAPGAFAVGPRYELTHESPYLKWKAPAVKILKQVERFGEELYQKGTVRASSERQLPEPGTIHSRRGRGADTSWAEDRVAARRVG